ncbi:hypothetical protein DBB29_01880 [Pandoraea cepalis]|uniref:HTH luxR-type domain-containing protein n=1 Tax=Pandoraea cepalis TaxID=2508294 RepID=A0AAW7MHN4_9BURK|nr:helix-turn-helix transcriptional regulator [Pandoraea cepalis]MDN4572266.1 hypothetical protein [Pandoraea cepalis]MDN4576873.1 hypothetical protein [Pandoraea cepalis]
MEFTQSEIAGLVEVLGTPQFGARLNLLANRYFATGHCTAFQWVAGQDPRCVVAEGHDDEGSRLAKELALEYTGGSYVNDAFVTRTMISPERGENVALIEPEAIKDAGFRERFYGMPQLRHELLFSKKLDDGLTCLSVYRHMDQPAFTPQELAEARSVAPLLLGFVDKQAWLDEHISESPQRRVAADPVRATTQGGAAILVPVNDGLSTEMRTRLQKRTRTLLLLSCAGLTEREADICSYIVLGFTTLAIGMLLEISVNTVATHRKHAYSKLGISSQTELFSKCLRLLPFHDNDVTFG